MFGDVIVPLDGSPEAARALGPAVTLASALNSAIKVVAYLSPRTHPDVEDAVRCQVAKLSGVETSVLVEEASEPVHEEIAAVVEADPVSLVCMTTAGRGRTAGLTGSVATAALRNLSRPVLLIGPNCDVGAFGLSGPMVVTVDESDRSNAILPIAESWAIAFGYDLEVITVIDPKSDDQLRAVKRADLVGDISIESVMVRRVAREMEKAVETTVNYEVLHGPHPDKEILRHAANRKAALVAMATHGETGVKRLVFGSVTAAVVHNAACPVLVIRPPNLY